MKILFFNYEYPPLGGGAGNATAWIMKEFSRMPGIEVDVVTSSLDSEYHLESIGNTIRIHKLPIGKRENALNHQSQMELLKYTWEAYWFSRRLMKEQKFDMSHSFFSVPCGFISLLLRYQYKLPYIISLRGSDVPGYSDRFSFLYTFIKPLVVSIWKRSHAVIANSVVLKILALKSAPSQKIDIIYNGVDTKRFYPNESNNVSDNFTVLCASRLSQRKGFRYAIDAFAQLIKKYPQIRMVIAGGEGDAETELKQQVKDLHLEDLVTFTGNYIPDDTVPRLYYQDADVFVFPSFNEGMSNNMLEAMACGLPIVMTPTGGAQELVRDGENGFIINFADADDIAEKVERLILDRGLARQMGKRSADIANGMSWENVAKQYLEVYRNVKK